tara:strand:- start:429 stop:677 length:249 start_codon:yes stop_codon:yes gene_type:complete
MIKAIKLLGFKSWLWWKKKELTYKFKQRRYWKAVEVMNEVLNRKLQQVNQEPKEKIWKDQAFELRSAIELVEEDIPYLDPHY